MIICLLPKDPQKMRICWIKRINVMKMMDYFCE